MLDAFAEVLAGRRRRRDRRHLGRPRPGHDHRLGGGPGRGGRARARPDPRRSRRAPSRRPPTGSRARSARATSCWSWAAALATGSASCCSSDLEDADDRHLRRGARPARGVRAGTRRPSTATPSSALFTEDAELRMRTRSARRSSGTTRCGHTCSRRPTAERDVDLTIERHWVSGDDRARRLARQLEPAAPTRRHGPAGRLPHRRGRARTGASCACAVDGHPRAPRG